MIPVHVISLKRSTDRRAAVAARLNELSIPFRFFDAIDGYAMSKAEMKAHRVGRNPRGHEVDPGEVGCYLSHVALYRELLAGPGEFFCVAEDDVVLSPRVRFFLEEENLRRLPSFDALRLLGDRGYRLPLMELEEFSIYAPYRPQHSTCFQIYSRAGLQRIVRYIPPPRMGIDLTLFTHVLIPRLRVLDALPMLAWPSGERSTIVTHNPENFTGPAQGLHVIGVELFRLSARLRAYRNFIRLWGYGSLRRLVAG